MARETYTEEELAQLTSEEREGLLDETLVDDGDEIAGDGAADIQAQRSVEGEEPPETEAAVAPEPAGDAPDPGEAEAAGGPAGEAAETPAPPAPTPSAPAAPARRGAALPAYAAPDRADDRIAALRQQQAELAARFDEGEVSASEYHSQRTALDDQVQDLREAKLRQSLALDAQKQAWVNDVVAPFFAANPDYADPAGALHQALDYEVRKRQASSYAEDPFNPQIIAESHEAVLGMFRRALGVTDAGGAALAAARQAGGASAATPAPAGPRIIPPTLASAPAAAGPGDDIGDTGRYAHLDRLAERDPLGYEAALAQLSDAQREAYLSA